MLSTCNNLSAGLSICLSDYGVEDAGPAKTKKRGNGEGGVWHEDTPSRGMHGNGH